MAISFVRTAHAGGGTAATTRTIAFDATGCDLLLVGCSDGGASSITGITYNGVALTLRRHDGPTAKRQKENEVHQRPRDTGAMH